MPALRPLLSLWRVRAGLLLAPVLGLVLWSNSLTDHLGYGAALVAALFASVLGALAGAGLPPAIRRLKLDVPGADAALIAALYPLALVGLVGVTVLLHGLVAPACGPAHGLAYWVLIPVPGAALAGLAGLCLGALCTRRGLGTVLAAALAPATIAWSVARFYATPAIFAYDPFFGFFPGALYDERVPLGLALVSYRLGTLGWIVALAGLCVAAWREGARWQIPTLRPSSIVAILGLTVGVAIYVVGPSLGHRHDRANLEAALEGRAWSRRCVVIYDPAIEARQARATAADCDIRVAQSESFFGVSHPQRIRVFLFRDAEQKQSLMGAADTYIAKPWRSEVYLQYAPFPHPVLKHEIAHVVAAAMAPGPLHITAYSRLLPVPGLIEGAAVASAWEGESDASPHQWAHAMLAAGMVPRVSQLTSLAFFASASVSAYTAAGSFCRWLVETRGRLRFQHLYASGDFSAVYGEPLSVLEREWHAFLRTVPVSEQTLSRARTRFRRASIFGRQCPFERDGDERQAARWLASGDLAQATAGYRALVANDRTDLRARVGVLEARVRAGDLAGARDQADTAGRELGPAAAARLSVRVADSVWRWRSPAEALAIYDAANIELLDEDEARTLVLKRFALHAGGPLAEALRDLLVGRGALEPSQVAAAATLGALQARAPSPVGAYLLGRQLFLQEHDPEAIAALDSITPETELDPHVRAETTRILSIARFRTGDLAGAQAGFESLANDPQRPEGLRDSARDWLDRIARTRALAPPAPSW